MVIKKLRWLEAHHRSWNGTGDRDAPAPGETDFWFRYEFFWVNLHKSKPTKKTMKERLFRGRIWAFV